MQTSFHEGKDTRVTRADIEDWPEILGLREYVVTSRAVNYISAEPEALKGFLHHSYTYPERVGLLLCWWGEHLVGMAAVLIVDQPIVANPGVGLTRQAFIHSVYIAPWVWDRSRVVKIRVPGYVGKEFCSGIEKWAKHPRNDGMGGAKFIYGNVRLDGNFSGFLRKFGFERQSVVVGKPL